MGLKTDWRKNLRFCEKNSFLNLIASRIVPAIGNVSKISKIAKDGESEKDTGVDLCDICRENTCFLDKMVCEKCWFLMPDTPFKSHPKPSPLYPNIEHSDIYIPEDEK